MSMKLLQGAVCAQITPLCEDGSIDLAGVRALTRRLVDGGIPCLYPNGTNGESLSLSQAEREAVAQAVVDEAGGRAPYTSNAARPRCAKQKRWCAMPFPPARMALE